MFMLRFVITFRPENGYGFKRPGPKTGAENDIFLAEIRSGFGETGGTPHQAFPGVPARGFSFMVRESKKQSRLKA